MKNKFLKILILAFIVQSIVFANTYAESYFPDAGVINSHDLDTLKKFESEKQVEQDFKRFYIKILQIVQFLLILYTNYEG